MKHGNFIESEGSETFVCGRCLVSWNCFDVAKDKGKKLRVNRKFRLAYCKLIANTTASNDQLFIIFPDN